MLKKIRVILITIILLVLFSTTVLSTELKTKLDVIKQASETKYLENDQGYISKTIVDSNAETGEITIELKLANTKKETEKVVFDSTEVIFVIDNSFSMEEIVSGTKTRRDVVIEAAKDFTSQLFKDVNNLKVGLTYYYGFDSDDEGKTTNQSYGTIETAKVLSNLTNDETIIQNALASLSSMPYNYGTNTDAGLQRAKSMFSSSETAQKFIILLSDGVPNHAVGVSITTGGWFGPTAEEQQESVKTKTKATLQSMSKENINLITMLTGLGELSDEDSAVLEAVFGTTTNPTVGSLYNIADTDISTIINDKIYIEVLEKVQSPINTVKIVDYFPKEITENFEFSYVGDTTIGNTSEGIDEETKTISWNIGILKGTEVATLKYKLKIKNMKNTDLLNKTIATNEKVVLTYKDTELNDYTVELTSSPKIQLSEVKEELTATVTYDPTTNTTGNVKATIKTNKPVKSIDGWEQSEDRKTLTKTYSTNTKETVLLIDDDNMEKKVEIEINNIVKANINKDNNSNNTNSNSNSNDKTTSNVILPDTGKGFLIIGIVFLTSWIMYVHKRNKNLKGI